MPSPEREIRPVLYTPPAWLTEADNDYVDELLKQSGYHTTDSKKGYERKRHESFMQNRGENEYDPTTGSSPDNTQEVQRIRTNQYISTLDIPEIDIMEEEEEEDDINHQSQEMHTANIREDEQPTENQDSTPADNIDSCIWWPSGYYFGDGSGGKYSRHPTLTRCGVGVQYVDEDKIPRTNISTPLPGPIQSNNRAELYALWLVVMNMEVVGK